MTRITPGGIGPQRGVGVIGVPLQVLLARVGAVGSTVDGLELAVAGDLAGQRGAGEAG